MSGRRYNRTILLLVAGLCLFAGISRAEDIKGLWKLWRQHQEYTDRHEELVEACRAFSASHPGDPMAAVAQSLEAWHCLKSGRSRGALAALEAGLATGEDALGTGTANLARAWLTRLDRERVTASLQVYYRKEIQYPNKLEEILTHPRIAETDHPPLTDRWGQPWQYRRTGFDSGAGFVGQRYVLESMHLGSGSDLQQALARPYGEQLTMRPTRISKMGGKQLAVQLEPVETSGTPAAHTGPLLMSAGTTTEGLYLAYASGKLVILCDDLHWNIFPGAVR